MYGIVARAIQKQVKILQHQNIFIQFTGDVGLFFSSSSNDTFTLDSNIIFSFSWMFSTDQSL